MAKKQQQYRALVGINYGAKDTRVEAGEVHAFPAEVAEVLLVQGAIEAVSETDQEG